MAYRTLGACCTLDSFVWW